MDRLVAIGDIHGCLHTLKDLLRMVSYSSQTDTLVFVGDYIDRGRFSCEVVNMLMKLQQQLGKDKVVCLRGNHEQMAIDAYRHGEYPLWYRNGGRFTEFSFEQNGEDIGNAISWFETLPLVYDTPEIIFFVLFDIHTETVSVVLDHESAKPSAVHTSCVNADVASINGIRPTSLTWSMAEYNLLFSFLCISCDPISSPK